MAETSTKPYMIRALYEWCCDNGYTPYLAVAVDAHTVVPRQHVKGGEIVLNVSPMATSRLSLGNELVEFQARFSGVAQQISIPIGNVSAIYARETGQGMAFEVSQAPAADDEGDAESPGAEQPGSAPSGDESARHARSSTVQSLRGGSRRRGPRRVDLEGPVGVPEASAGAPPVLGGADLAGSHVEADEGPDTVRIGTESDNKKAGPSDVAANSRKRGSKGQGSADVLAFAPSTEATRKKAGSSTAESKSERQEDAPGTLADGNDEDPPPADGSGKGGKARLTRVK